MRHSTRSIPSFPSIAALILITAASGRRVVQAGPATPSSTAARPGDAAFRADIERFIEEQFRLRPESATWEGYHRYDSEASDLSPSGVEKRILQDLEWKVRFSAIDAKSLSPNNEADREWLIAVCDSDLLWSRRIRNYQREPGMYIPTAGVYALLERDFAPPAERMRLITARERASMKNFGAARRNLRPDTMPKIAATIVAQEMAGTLAFFSKELPAAFASVPDDSSKKDFLKVNADTIAAIRSYQKWLLESVAPKASDNFAIGAENYRRMLADDDMVDTPFPRLEEIGLQELARLQEQFRETAAKIDPNRSPAQILKAISSKHPPADEVLPAVASGLAALRAFVVAHHLATIPSGATDPMVRETPPYMRATTFASMDSPGPYEKSTQAYFYVTIPDRSWNAAQTEQALELFSAPTISDISVHEVYPGHYVQFLDDRTSADKIRSVFFSGSNVEGWAFYCEQLMLDEGLHRDDPAYRFAELQMALQRACRYLVGIRMHTQGMTVAQAAKFFEQNAYMTPHNAMVEALRGTQDPGYLCYQLGKLMILKLRADMRKKEGAAFNLGRFHDAFLAQGGVPIKLIRRAMLGSDGPIL